MSAIDEVAMPAEENTAASAGGEEAAGGFPLVSLAVAALAVLLTAAYWLLFGRGGPGGRGSRSSSAASLLAAPTAKKVNGVVLVGCCGAGKTVLLHQLTSGTAPATLPSMAPACHAVALPSGKTVQVVDVPGHPRLRLSLLAHLAGARGVAFVLDAAAGAESIKQAAALLFDVLVAEELGAATPLLVFCNKGDLAGAAKRSDRVQGLLERELDALRKTRGTMEAAGDPVGRRRALGDAPSAPFKFGDLHGRRVVVGSGSAADPSAAGGLAAVVAFLEAAA